LVYSRGFNPRPKLQLAAALPLGHTGEAELLDVWLEKQMSVGDLTRALVPTLPDGLAISQVCQVHLKEPAMQTQVASAEYRVTVEWGELAEQVDARVRRVLAATELLLERRGRQYNLRSLIERLWLERVGEGQVVLGMQLSARSGATARPEDVLEVMNMREAFAHYHRRRLLFESTAGGVVDKT
jgi:radical SAM-linked protein